MSDAMSGGALHAPLPCLPAICYSGYRAGQSPGAGVFPSASQIAQDLRLLQAQGWRMLRLYDCGPHARLVLECIEREALDLRVLLGAYLEAEIDNPGCPWGVRHDDATLRANRSRNDAEVARLSELLRRHRKVVVAGAVGNEACVDWTDHLVEPRRVRELLESVRGQVDVPLTVCDNYVPWLGEMGEQLGDAVDFISIHSYPAWEQRPVEQALAHTQADHAAVAQRFPRRQVVITEAGWPSVANDRGIPAHAASEHAQQRYLRELLDWSRACGVPCFVFEAFDEAWKGSEDPREPEKHWGLYDESRLPKRFAAQTAALA